MNKYQKAFTKTSLKEFLSLCRAHERPGFTQEQLSLLIWLQEVVWQAILDNKIRYSRKLAKTRQIWDTRKIWWWKIQMGVKYTLQPVWPLFKNNVAIEYYLH